MKDDKYYHYLGDLVFILKKDALDLVEKLKAENIKDEKFNQGVLAAYYRVITLMQQQAEGFDISLSDIGLDDINPDKDLT
jgi:broad-specificity NMP kinase